MKIKTLVVCLFVLFGVKAFSQSYIPFVQEGKMWTEVFSSAIDPNESVIIAFEMKGDTSIDGNIYKKIIDNYGYCHFCVKEDTIQKKVYCRYTSGNYEYLLYDFSVQVGDTIDNLDCPLVVLDRTVEFFAGRNRIKQTLDFWEPMVCYEGIGGFVQGVFYEKCIVGTLMSLLCYFENDTLLYHDNTLNDDCFLITETQKLQPDNTFDTYFSENSLHVILTKPVPYTLFVYDLFGRKLCQISASEDMEKDFSNLPAGMYLWRVESKGESGVFSGKFLKN